MGSGIRINRITSAAYAYPTDKPESDGTFAWDRTTIVIVEINAGDVTGLGYTYASAAAAHVIKDELAPLLLDRDPFDIPAIAGDLSAELRNAGRPGMGATAISAVDNALWDTKARAMGLSLVDLLGAARDSIPAYGSGGFTSYTASTLRDQFRGWAQDGFGMVKMKIGRDSDADPARVQVARDAIGADVELFVDANGAYRRREAVAASDWLGAFGVTWFEEPVSSNDRDGLRFVRQHVPRAMAVAAGEYGWTPTDFRDLLAADSVDVLQIDATRSLGISGFVNAAAMAEAHELPVSAHCAPALHASLACAVRNARHIEWFHDHVRLERAFFDGCPSAAAGRVAPNRDAPGLGISLKRQDVARYLVWQGECTA